jgi:L-alanine-DL-glutamate epimerase-like enolase superfamily enzyme
MDILSFIGDRIKTVQGLTVPVPLDNPPAHSTRLLTQRHYTITRIRTEAGIEGMGFCYAGDRSGGLVTRFVRDLLRDHAIGKDPGQVDEIWTGMYDDAILLGRRGAALRAMSSIDMAIWDIIAKSRELPLHSLLGNTGVDTVPCYASGGYYRRQVDPVEYIREEVHGYVDAGFKAVKIKIGRLPLQDELKRVRAAREALGPDRLLMLDANNAWKNATSAIQDINALAEFDPFWVEEPLMPDDMRGHAEIRRTVCVPIATGEIEATRWGFSELLKLEAADMLQPDAAVLGGISEFLKVSELASEQAVPLYPHAMHQLHVSLAASLDIVRMVEYFSDNSVLNLGKLLKESASAVNGRLAVPQDPGIGLRFDEEALDHYSVDEWE